MVVLSIKIDTWDSGNKIKHGSWGDSKKLNQGELGKITEGRKDDT